MSSDQRKLGHLPYAERQRRLAASTPSAVDSAFAVAAAGARAKDEIERRLKIYDVLVPSVRNIIYNVEQNPAAHTVLEIIHSLREALGLKPGDRV